MLTNSYDFWTKVDLARQVSMLGYFGFKKQHFSEFIKLELFLKKHISEKMRIGKIVGLL